MRIPKIGDRMVITAEGVLSTVGPDGTRHPLPRGTEVHVDYMGYSLDGSGLTIEAVTTCGLHDVEFNGLLYPSHEYPIEFAAGA